MLFPKAASEDEAVVEPEVAVEPQATAEDLLEGKAE